MGEDPEIEAPDEMHEMADDVAAQWMSGKHRLAIVNDLVSRGVPLQTAKELVDAVRQRVRPAYAAGFVKLTAGGAIGLAVGIVITYHVAPLTPPPGIRHPIEFAYAWCGACVITIIIGLIGWFRNR